MPSRLHLPDALRQVSTETVIRLDSLDTAVPSRKTEPELPFAEYVVQAREYARRDPVFRRQFEDAMSQYERLQGNLP